MSDRDLRYLAQALAADPQLQSGIDAVLQSIEREQFDKFRAQSDRAEWPAISGCLDGVRHVRLKLSEIGGLNGKGKG